MFATLLTLAFSAAAVLACAVIAASLAKGLAAATSLRQQLAQCSDERLVVIRHLGANGMCEVTPRRRSRRSVQPALLRPLPARQRVAA